MQHRGPYTRLPGGRIDCEVYAPELGAGDGGYHPTTLSQADPLTAALWAAVNPLAVDMTAEQIATRARNGMSLEKADFIIAVANAGWCSEAQAITWAETGTMPFAIPFADRVAFAQKPAVHRHDAAVAAIAAGKSDSEIDALFGGA
jgi:hypothetical protein